MQQNIEAFLGIESNSRSRNALSKKQVAALIAQVDKYPNPDVEADLKQPSKYILWEGIKDYRLKYKQNAPTFTKFREDFIRHIETVMKRKSLDYAGSAETRKTNPEKATIKAEDFLGADGLRLYELALEEERNSPNYRKFVFDKSIIPVPELQTPPVIMIGGPSASGKSHATLAVLDLVAKLPKSDSGKSGNFMVCVDGGIVREMSQMRKLVIRASLKKGYSGIEDLHDKSSVLEKIKTFVQLCALSDPKFGLVVPETFSNWIIPWKDGAKFMKEVAWSHRQLLFANVEGDDPAQFKKSVECMGSKRAWAGEVDDVDMNDLNLKTMTAQSQEKLPESKAYGPKGFNFGVHGSNEALLAYLKIQEDASKPPLTIRVINDLIPVRRSISPGEAWIPANQGDGGIFMVSKAIFKEWSDLPANQRIGLKDYSRQHAKPNIKVDQENFQYLTELTSIPPAPVAVKAKKLSEEFKQFLVESRSNDSASENIPSGPGNLKS